MTYTKEELRKFNEEMVNVAKRLGVSVSTTIKCINTVNIKSLKDMNHQEFLKYVEDLMRELFQAGIDSHKISTIISEAIHTRERELTTRVETVKTPQVVYGPPPREEIHVVERNPQVVYGPPPREEIHVVYEKTPQVVYGPPPREIHEVVINNPQCVYGPPPQSESGSRRR